MNESTDKAVPITFLHLAFRVFFMQRYIQRRMFPINDIYCD